MRRVLIAALAAAMLAGCTAQGRTADQLRATTLGKLDPTDSSPVFEVYAASEWNIEGPNCAHLYRWIATNDAEGFLASALAATTAAGGTVIRANERPSFEEGLYRGSDADLDVNGTRVDLKLHDLRSTGYRPPAQVDTSRWRYVAELHIWDEADTTGGGCR